MKKQGQSRLSQPCKQRAAVLQTSDSPSTKDKRDNLRGSYSFGKQQPASREQKRPDKVSVASAAAAGSRGRTNTNAPAEVNRDDIKSVMSLWNQHKSNIAIHESHLLQLQLDTFKALNVVVDSSAEGPRRSLIQDLIRVDKTLLKQNQLATDYAFQKPNMENNTVQMCAWDDHDPSPKGLVSGFVNVRSLLNVNMQLDAAARLASSSPETLGSEIPFVARIMGNPAVHALRHATAQRPVVHAAMDALQHVFQVSKDRVRFTNLGSAQPKYSVPYGEKMSFVHTVCTNSRVQCLSDDAPAWAKDMDVEHVVVSDHSIVRSRRFIAEAVTVTNRATKQKAHFVVTNSALQHQPEPVSLMASVKEEEQSMLHEMKSSMETAAALDTKSATAAAAAASTAAVVEPSTFAHVFGLGEMLVGESKSNLLQENLKHLQGTADSVMHGVLCMRAISKQVARDGPDSLLSKAFSVCNSDPVLSLANVFPVVDHQGMRVLHLTLNYANKTTHPLNVCIVLTAVKQCSDQDVAPYFPSTGTGTVFEPKVPRQGKPVDAVKLPFMPPEAKPASAALLAKPMLPSVDTAAIVASPASSKQTLPPPASSKQTPPPEKPRSKTPLSVQAHAKPSGARSNSAPTRERPLESRGAAAVSVTMPDSDSFLDSLMNNTQRMINDLVRLS